MTTLAPTGQGWSTTSCSSLASTEWSGQHAVPISTRLRTSGMSWIAKSGATTLLPGMPNICSRCCRLSGRRLHRGSSPTWSAMRTRCVECQNSHGGYTHYWTFESIQIPCFVISITLGNQISIRIHLDQMYTPNNCSEIEWNCVSLSLKHRIKCLPNFNALAFFFGKLWICVQVILNFLCVV